MSTNNNITNRYKDLDISFEKNPRTKDFYGLTDIEAVKRSVKLLVLTNFYERPFNPELGGDVLSNLFENITPFTILVLKRTISDVITNYEPRAKLLSVNITDSQLDRNTINVAIYFSIVNLAQSTSINISLEKVR